MPAAKKSKTRETYDRWERRITRWGIPFLIAIFVIAELLHHYEILNRHEAFEYGAILAALGLIVRLMVETHDALKEEAEHLEMLLENLTPKLLSLDQCVESFGKSLVKDQHQVSKLMISHLGLDMQQAWGEVKTVLRQLTNLNVEYHLAMMDHSGTMGVANHLAAWRSNAQFSFNQIKAEVGGLQQEFAARGRSLKFIVKLYQDEPTVHGIAIVEPPSQRMSFIAFCRWSGPPDDEFDWGKKVYHRILGVPVDEGLKDLQDVFDGYFHHYWQPSVQWPANP